MRDPRSLNRGDVITLSTTACSTQSKGTVVSTTATALNVRFDDMFDVVQTIPFSEIVTLDSDYCTERLGIRRYEYKGENGAKANRVYVICSSCGWESTESADNTERLPRHSAPKAPEAVVVPQPTVIHVQTEADQYGPSFVGSCPGKEDIGIMSSRKGKKLAGTLDSATLHLTGTYYRFGFGYSEPNTWYNASNGSGRKFTTEPVGYTFGLASCISANPNMGTGASIQRLTEAGMYFEVADGDILVTDYQYAFKVRVVRREFLELDYLGPWHVVRDSQFRCTDPDCPCDDK